ncbi:hypothetical protein DAI22_01g170400 [Oryza sativa Japonica Group]|nr:hypothetical protein DAI22_01g170400 [Oryza sativa Japonica Group]KAF2950193.1 hypothetical protein DAI22_01g170400 [Oryza sativa Japonica Group]
MSKRSRSAMSSAGEEVEASTLITLRVKDNEGVRITCTMRRTDKLRVLIGFYLDMVTPTDKGKGAAVAAAAGGGVFMHYGRCVTGNRTPADYDMEDGDEVSFFPDGTRTMPVTLTVKDNKGRRVTHTMRRLDVICTLFRLYFDMLPSTAPREGVFMYNGREISFYQTPEKCDMNDGDEITFHLFSKPSTFVTLTIKGSTDDGGRSGVVVTRPMRRTDELQRLIDYYFAMVPTDDQNGEWAVTYGGRQVGGEETPADYEMEDGDQLRLVPASKPSRFVTIDLLTMVKAKRTYTLRRTDKLQGLMDLCLSREPATRRRLPEPLAASSHVPAGPPGAAANSERAPAAAAPPTPPPPRACPTLALPRRCRLLAAASEPGSPSAGAFSTTAAASSRVASGVLGSPSAGSSSRAPAGELWWVTALRSTDSRLRHREATIQYRRDRMGSQLKGALAAATVGRT